MERKIESIFTVEYLDKLLSKYDGNRSVIFPLIKDKFMAELMVNPDKSGLHEGEESLFSEFAFFEDDYMLIRKDIILNELDGAIVDIGCQLGLQSELFLDKNYIGIDCMGEVFLNQDIPNINYIKKLFPIKELDLTDKIVISNMSLGFFNNFIDKKEHTSNKEEISDTDKLLIAELSKAKVLYCCSRIEFIEELKNHFAHCEKAKGMRENPFRSGVYKFY